jgi:glutamyl-tRNA reductase
VHIIALGLNHNSAPIELRESVAISDTELPGTLKSLADLDNVRECAILSTCNRTELFVLTQAATSYDEVLLGNFFASLHGESNADLFDHLYFYRDISAVEHLLKVASGLDSMMLGEYQIMAQVKSALAVAQAAQTTGATLNNLFQSALNTGKRVRTDTQISRGAFSVGGAAVEFATRIFGDTLQSSTVLLIGAGQTSELTARHLQAHGATKIFVANRTRQRADALASQLEGATAVDYSEVDGYLVKANIVICSTSADRPVITTEMIQTAMRMRRNRPLYLVDVAVPRDVEPSAGDIENVFLYNIDDLSQVVQHSQDERLNEIKSAEIIVAEAAMEFMSWRKSLDSTPMIISVREHLESLRLDEMARLRAKLPHLDEREIRAIEQSLQSFSNKIAHDAIKSIKASFTKQDNSSYARLEAIQTAFGLDEKPEK